MAKKLGRLILFSALTGAAAAGTYDLLQKKNDSPLKDVDDIDDFDDFDDWNQTKKGHCTFTVQCLFTCVCFLNVI